jgi:hypothetical protein
MLGKLRMTLSSLIALFDGHPGFSIKDCLRDEVLEIKTESGHTYFMLVVDPEKNLVALASDDSLKLPNYPVWFYLKGSTLGGSMIKMNWVAENMRLEFRSVAYQIPLRLSLANQIRVASDKDTVRIRSEAENLLLVA